MATLFTWYLRVILIALPSSTKRPTSLSHPTHFLYSVTLDTKGQMISRLPTRVQIASNRKLLQSSNSLYPGFPVYLTTIGGRLSFINVNVPYRTYTKSVRRGGI